MQNLEIKATYDDLDRARQLAMDLSAEKMWTKRQTDTYFIASVGKLKLRQVDDEPAELIAYQRPNESTAKLSDYLIYRSAQGTDLSHCLNHALGIDTKVIKKRTLFLWNNVRIHFDEVEELGAFIEFEAVLENSESLDISQERVEFLLKHFQIQKEHLKRVVW